MCIVCYRYISIVYNDNTLYVYITISHSMSQYYRDTRIIYVYYTHAATTI